ncbi:MAG: hypothetical protein V4757_07720 [Pseudomonadota bacterium]
MAKRTPMLAELRIDELIAVMQREALAFWQFREREAIIAIVRTLDMLAVRRMWRNSSDGSSNGQKNEEFFAFAGVAAALKPFLTRVEGFPGPLPWHPMTPQDESFARWYLNECGELSYLKRLAATERYGLVVASLVGDNKILLSVSEGAPEYASFSAMKEKRSRTGEKSGKGGDKRGWERRHRRMQSFVDVVDGWFIRYDNDWEIVEAYRSQAQAVASTFFEAEALDSSVVLGDRDFGTWKHACDQALGRVLAHIDFAAILERKRPGVRLIDTFTIFARREDVAAVWEEAGLPRSRIAATMKALTLDADGLADWESAHETPCPFYVDLGKNFVLMPCFGALTNPYFALFRHLRVNYQRDWDRGVDLREAAFRQDLADMFPEPNFSVPSSGFAIRRTDGTLLTDIDAVVLDRRSGALALVQLKWHDVFGRSLAERESRRRNIEKANEWVGKVSDWIDGRSSADVAKGLGLTGLGASDRPLIYVLARYNARFSGETNQDKRAEWLGWHEMLASYRGDEENPLVVVPKKISERQQKLGADLSSNSIFQFSGCEIELRIGPKEGGVSRADDASAQKNST